LYLQFHDYDNMMFAYIFLQNKVIFDYSYCFNYYLDDTLYVQGMTKDPSLVHLNSITRTLGYIVLV
jgi:hypothetical protein